MRPSLEQLKTTLSGLAVEERAALAHYLLRSLDQEVEDATAEWLSRREATNG